MKRNENGRAARLRGRVGRLVAGLVCCAAMALPGPIMAGGGLQAKEGFPQKVLYAKGGATPTRLDWTFGGEQRI